MRAPYKLLLLSAIAANCVTILYAVAHFRPLWGDGALFLFRILDTGQFNLDDRTFRKVAYLAQIPAVLLRRLAPSAASLPLSAWFFGSVYQLHPILSLWVSWRLCRRQVPLLFLFPALSFATATQVTLPFAVGEIPITLSLFWPAALILAIGRFSTGDRALLIICLIASLTSHEAGFALMGVLTAFSWGALRRELIDRPAAEARAVRRTLVTSLFISAFGAGWLGYWGLRGYGDLNSGFMDAAFRPFTWGSYTFVALIEAIAFSAFVALAARAPERSWHRGLPLVGLALGLILYLCHDWDDLHKATIGRAVSIPIAALLSTSMAISLWKTPYAQWTRRISSRMAVSAVAGALLLAAVHDYRVTDHWIADTRGLLAQIGTLSGGQRAACVLLEPAAARAFMLWPVPPLSALLSQSVGTRRIAGVRGTHGRTELEFCAGVARGRIPMPGWTLPSLHPLGFP